MIELNLEESLKFLTAWIKGLYINQKIPLKFDSRDCIMKILVHNESEFQSSEGR